MPSWNITRACFIASRQLVRGQVCEGKISTHLQFGAGPLDIGNFTTPNIFLDEAAIVLQQYEIVSGSKYTLRTKHSFFPCQ